MWSSGPRQCNNDLTVAVAACSVPTQDWSAISESATAGFWERAVIVISCVTTEVPQLLPSHSHTDHPWLNSGTQNKTKVQQKQKMRMQENV